MRHRHCCRSRKHLALPRSLSPYSPLSIRANLVLRTSPQPTAMVTLPSRPRKLTIPPLENGDRLSRPEFERRYSAMTDVKKADLIEGIVYMASPLRFEPHAEPHADVITWLGLYVTESRSISSGKSLMNVSTGSSCRMMSMLA